MQIKEMKTMFKFSGDVSKIILRGEPGAWILSVFVGPCGMETLEIARGGNRTFKTLDSAFEIARDLEAIHSDHHDKPLPVEIVLD